MFAQDVRDQVFREIEAADDFWLALDPYHDTRAALQRLARLDRVYFLTRRFGPTARAQTATWLRTHGYQGDPAVLVVPTDHAKGEIARALQLTGFLDDTVRVVQALARAPQCQVRLIARPWNQHFTIGRRVKRVLSVVEALDDLLTAPPAGPRSEPLAPQPL
jgi:hypothetical protein